MTYHHNSSGTSELPGKKSGTSGSTQSVDEIKANGLKALDRLKSNHTLEDWLATGQALLVITDEALAALALPAGSWDKDNKKLIKEFTSSFEAWEQSGGSNQPHLTKQERWALRELMTDQKYHDYYMTLDSPTRRRLNYPNSIIKKYKADHKVPKQKAILSPGRNTHEVERLDARNDELQQELTSAKQQISDLEKTAKPSLKNIRQQLIGQLLKLKPAAAQKWIADLKKQITAARKKETTVSGGGTP